MRNERNIEFGEYWIDNAGSCLFRRQGAHDMFMKLLARISRETLPMEMTEPEDIHSLYVLRAAGYLYATIPLPRYAIDGGWHQEPARVFRITPYGHAVLRFTEMTDTTRFPKNPAASIDGLFNIDPFAFRVAPKQK